MKYLYIILIFGFLSCTEQQEERSLITENWSKRSVESALSDSLEFGKSYLSVYSQIYSMSEHKKQNLTVMVSLRNTSVSDTVYITKSDYYNSHGEIIKEYLEEPIYLGPMETIEIIISEDDISGGTGSNFIFEWKVPKDCPDPLFEGIMSSTRGQQGLSFTTVAKRIK